MRLCGHCKGLHERGEPCSCRTPRQRTYDVQRGTRQARGYDAEWYRWRARVLQDYDMSLCGDRPPQAPATTDSLCLQQGLARKGDDLDHISPITDKADPRRLDESNVQLLCDGPPNHCHSVKRQRESHASRIHRGDV